VEQRLAPYFTIFLLLSTAAAIAQVSPTEYSADMVTHTQRGDMTGKFFFTPAKTRMDMQTPGGAVSTITDVSAKKVILVMHDRQVYMEHNVNQANPMARGPKPPDVRQFDPANPSASHQDSTCRKLGWETVNGRSCDRWEFTKNNKIEETEWIDRKLHVIVKPVRDDGSGFEFQNLEEGPQPETVFVVPSGYQKFDMGSMMRGMGKDQ
jgi:hypothetical protein